MALAIDLDPHDTGTASSYWRITQAHIDHTAGQVTVWLHGWRDVAARLQSRAASASLTFVLHGADFAADDLHGLTTQRIYAALKRQAARAEPALQHALGSRHATILLDATDC